MRFQIWGLMTGATDGLTFEKLGEGATLAALLSVFRVSVTNSRASRLWLIDTTNSTITLL